MSKATKGLTLNLTLEGSLHLHFDGCRFNRPFRDPVETEHED